MNRQIRQVAFLVVVMFAALALSVTSVQGLARPAIWEPWSANGALNSDPRNRRAVKREFNTERGPILLADTNKTAIASTEKSEDGQGSGSYQRVYANGPLYAPVTGYFSPAFASMTGMEKEGNSVLNGDDPSLFSSRIKTLITGDSQRGGAVELTIKPEIQQAAYEALGNREGAVVALDPSTGAILAMVSSPSYDPSVFATRDGNAANEANTNLSEDSSRPLDNRAIAGNLYPPGSTFKIITTAAALRTGKVTPDQEVDAPRHHHPAGHQPLPGELRRGVLRRRSDQLLPRLRRVLQHSLRPAGHGRGRRGARQGGEELGLRLQTLHPTESDPFDLSGQRDPGPDR